MKTVIYHSADFDGIFCREIAKKFLGEKDVQYIGWNFGDPQIPFPNPPGTVYVMDLPCNRTFIGYPNSAVNDDRIVWIDHHKSSIDSHPTSLPGYRIDGVAACRLAWQWFAAPKAADIGISARDTVPNKQDFIDRKISEPLAVRLAGEYDVWDKRDPRAAVFQYGLRSVTLTPTGWEALLSMDETLVNRLLSEGEACQRYAQHVDSGSMKASFLAEWEGLKFLCLNGRGNSLTFASKDVPETGHAALLMFYTNGQNWIVSLYHAKHRTDLDLSQIAVKHGGGGHKGACGFTCTKLPFLL